MKAYLRTSFLLATLACISTFASACGSRQDSAAYGNVGVGGGQDFAAFRRALDEGRIPSSESLDSTGFFAEHDTTLPPPTCAQTFCLHGTLSVGPDLVHGAGTMTLLQVGMNAAVDPAKVTRPPLDVAVVLDRSGSMADASKLDFAKQGVKLLIDALGAEDTFTLVAFDDQVTKLFGPAKVTDKRMLEGLVDEIAAGGSTNIYDALVRGYEDVLSAGGEGQVRRVIFLTDGVPTAGDVESADILKMSAGYNEKSVGLTVIGLGSDVDASLLRSLSESSGGNFYYLEKPEAVKEVFTEELSFFVAPVAYDVDVIYDALPGYSVADHYGTNLWETTSGGARIHIPSVFFVSRTSTAPGPNGGRRGGGAAIMARLDSTLQVAAGIRNVAGLHLRYRSPGTTTYVTEDVPVTWDGSTAPDGQYYSDASMAKNSTMLAFYMAFREATDRASSDPKGALDLLAAFEPRIAARLAGTTDEDLADDLRILRQYVSVLKKVTSSP